MKPWRVLALTFGMVVTNIAGISSAQAIADGTFDCGTSGTFTVVSNEVTTNTNCRGSLTIPEGVTDIKRDAFNVGPDRSSFITSIIFPNSLTTIKEGAFRAASRLTSIDFGTGVQSIVHWNFADSTSLTSVTIPSSVTSIGVGVFYGSTQLESVTFLDNAPSVNSNAFNGLKAGAVANVSSSATGFGANGSIWKYLLVSVSAPAPSAPGAPTIGTASALSPTSASISFTAPVSNGGATIETYTATSTPGSVTGRLLQSGSGSITITGLTSSTAYTFSITASNSAGTSSASSASVSITMPSNQAEIDATTLAAQKAAEARREAEKQAARVEISKGLIESKMPTIQQFVTAEISGITEKNFPLISKEMMAMTLADRSDMKLIEKVSKKYLILDSICTGGKFSQFFAIDLSSVGLINVENQVAITYALRKLPLDERDDYEKITAAINKELEVTRIRAERLAAVLALQEIRQSA